MTNRRKPVKFLGHTMRRSKERHSGREMLEVRFTMGDLKVHAVSSSRGMYGSHARVFIDLKGRSLYECAAWSYPEEAAEEAAVELELKMLRTFKALGALLDYDVED